MSNYTDISGLHVRKEVVSFSTNTRLIGDFRVAFRLCFKASPGAKISFIHMQILVHLHVNKTNFHMKGFAPGLALKQRRKATQKSPKF